MGFLAKAFGYTRGQPHHSTPTPYTLVPRPAGLGIGVSNFSLQRPQGLRVDSVLGAQGICVQRTMQTERQGFYVGAQSLKQVDLVAFASGVNMLPDLTQLYDPHANGGSL